MALISTDDKETVHCTLGYGKISEFSIPIRNLRPAKIEVHSFASWNLLW